MSNFYLFISDIKKNVFTTLVCILMLLMLAPSTAKAGFNDDYNLFCKDLGRDLLTAITRAEGLTALKRTEARQVAELAEQYTNLLDSIAKQSNSYADQRRVATLRRSLGVYKVVWIERSRTFSERSDAEAMQFAIRGNTGYYDKQLVDATNDMKGVCGW